jgi:hypothetical protein
MKKLIAAQKVLTNRLYRQYFYEKEADPLFAMFNRGEIEKDVWLAKIAEIKTRLPYPDGLTFEMAQQIVDEHVSAELEADLEVVDDA